MMNCTLFVSLFLMYLILNTYHFLYRKVIPLLLFANYLLIFILYKFIFFFLLPVCTFFAIFVADLNSISIAICIINKKGRLCHIQANSDIYRR